MERVAKHIIADSGYSTSRAIAAAVSQAKKRAAAGNAQAARAVAQWEALKAKAAGKRARKGSEHAADRALALELSRHGPLGPGTAPHPREVLMAAVPPQFQKNNSSSDGPKSSGKANGKSGPPGSQPKKIATVADVKKAVQSIKKLPPPMQPRAAARVVAAARQIGGEALSAVPTAWLKGNSKADSGKGSSKPAKSGPPGKKGPPSKKGAPA